MENAKCYAPQILVGTEGLPREQWLEYRRKGIGGSDAAAVLGISPFRTGRDLYYDKLNIVTADDAENWVQLEVGTLLEPLVAKIFAHKTGYKIYRRPFMFQHPLYPWMLADLDYMVELPDGTTAILEIKTTNYNAKDNWWYLGLTEQEYDAYLQTAPGVSFQELLDSQRKTQRFRVYQLELEHGDTRTFAFGGIDALQKAGFQQPPAAEYTLVYDGELICPVRQDDRDILERIFERYNQAFPPDYHGRSIAPSDVLELYDESERRYFYCDMAGFVQVKFSPALAKKA